MNQETTTARWVNTGYWECPAEATGTGKAEPLEGWELELLGLSPDGPAPEPEPAPVLPPPPARSEVHVSFKGLALDLVLEAFDITDREALNASGEPFWKDPDERPASRYRGAEVHFGDLAPGVYVGAYDEPIRRREGRNVAYLAALEGSHALHVASTIIALGDLDIPRDHKIAVIRRMWRMRFSHTSYISAQ